MDPSVEAPTITRAEGSPDQTVETHPAYAMIRASRVQGRAHLFGSDFEHQHYMIIEIARAELHRTLSNDWFHAREEYIEVGLSEAQWATFLSSPNTSGVPCTLTHRNGARLPAIARPRERTAQFRDEMAANLADARTALTELREKIEGGSKSKRELLDLLAKAERELEPRNLQFVADQFGEHMEQTVERAKVEVAAYVQGAVTRAGLSALRGDLPLALGETSDVVDAERPLTQEA